MRLVVDASLALAWVLPDEHSDYANATLRHVLADGALVPGIWPAEMANGLLMAVRRKRLTQASLPAALALLERLRVEVEGRVERGDIRRLFDLGHATGLTAYDASYLDLALCSGYPLGTLDGNIRRAADSVGAAIFDGQPREPAA